MHNRPMSETDGAHAPDEGRAEEERVLLALVARGGPTANSAMRTLFVRYQGRFKSHLRSRGFRDADIDDVTQRVWGDVARKAGKFSADGVPGAWLWGFLDIAKKDVLRTNAQRGDRFVSGNDDRQTSPSEQPSMEANAPSPEAQRKERDFKDCVQRAFAAFKRQHSNEAWWVYLRHVEDWDLDQIARYRGSSPHAAAQFLSKARKEFRELLAPCIELKTG